MSPARLGAARVSLALAGLEVKRVCAASELRLQEPFGLQPRPDLEDRRDARGPIKQRER